MDGGKPKGATGDQDKERRELTRRDFTRLGAVAGGLAWTAPKITTMRFAQKVVGSHTTTTTSTTETVPSTSSTTTTRPSTTTSTTLGPTGSTETTSTTQPPGTTTTGTGPPVTNLGSTVSTSTSTTSTSVPTSTTVAGVNRPGGVEPPGGPPRGLGSLSFTGADTVDLAVFGATAVVTGRMLYAFGRRAREEDTDLDDDTTPSV